MTTFDLPADTQDLSVTFIVPKELRPYLTKFYQATKRDGDTVDDYLLRMVVQQAVSYFSQEKIGEAEGVLQAQTPRQDIRTEMRTFLTDNNIL